LVKPLNPLIISGREALPLVEGGKGISISNGESSGAWAASGGIGTFSGVNADSYNDKGELIPQIYYGRTRRERHEELVAYAIRNGGFSGAIMPQNIVVGDEADVVSPAPAGEADAVDGRVRGARQPLELTEGGQRDARLPADWAGEGVPARERVVHDAVVIGSADGV
jgi:hypothetical protein